MTQREEFEAWFVKAYHPASLQPMEHGCYLNLGAGMAWDAWQAAQAAQAAQPGWRTIESAPKDGTVILGYRNGRIGTASKVPRDDCEMWTFCGTSAWVEIHPTVKPTHWMPLPAAPSTKEQSNA